MRAVLLTAALVSAAACVPDFAFRDGGETTTSAATTGGDDTGSGGRRGQGGDGGGRPGVGVASGPGTGPATGPGPGPGPTSQSASATVTTGPGGGEGGEPNIGPTGSTSNATGSSSATGTPGHPCAQDQGQTETCQPGDVCCFASDYLGPGCEIDGNDCDLDYETPLGCNETSDCPGQLCCANIDFFDVLTEIVCDTACNDFQACNSAEECPGDDVCYYVFNPDEFPEYAAYGYCSDP